MAGTYTGSPLTLYKPADGETGWGSLVDANFQAINDQASRDLYADVDYTIHADGSGYYARDERAGTQPYTGTDLSSVWNAVAKALNNNQQYDGAGSGFWDSLSAGGSWAIARKSNGAVLSTDNPLFVYNGQSVINNSPSNIIQASSSFPNTGTQTNGTGALVSCGYGTNLGDTCLRVKVTGLTLDCNSRAAQGILFRRNQSGSVINPGSNGLSRFSFNEAYNFTVAGIHNGLIADAGSGNTGSSNSWYFQNFIHAGLAGSYAWYNATGDSHVLFNNFVQDRQTGSYCFYIDELGVHARFNHIGWQGSTVATPNANVILNGGGSSMLIGNYIDNAGANGQAAVEVTGGNNISVFGNHFNWSDSDGTGKSVVYIDGNQSYVRVVGNRISGPTSVADGAELIRCGNGIKDTTSLVGNSARGVKGFFQGSFAPAEMTGNQINNIAGSTQSNDEIKIKAGAPIDGDYIQAYNGIHAFDSTNVRDYWRMNGTWRYAQMV